MRVIARIRSDFSTKFGIPRQSGLVQDLKAAVVFEPEYRSPDALRGLEEYTHIWLIWQFSQAVREDGSWTATVRPPRLGGNVRMMPEKTSGRGRRIRTLGTRFWRPLLYQLSYAPK